MKLAGIPPAMITTKVDQIPVRVLNEAQGSPVKCLRCSAMVYDPTKNITYFGRRIIAMYGHALAAMQVGWVWWSANDPDEVTLSVLADQPLEGWLCTKCQE